MKLKQYSTISSLIAGHFSGSFNYKDILNNVDFGLGTFESLDGELIVIRGKAYQLKADGQVNIVTDDMTTPFASLCKFKSDIEIDLNNLNRKEIEKTITNNITSKNYIWAIHIKGSFDLVTTRTVTKQEKPYPRLANATDEQIEFAIKKAEGDIVGFWSPKFTNTTSIPGYHFHFIDESKTKGGHVLDIKINKGTCYLGKINVIENILPTDNDYKNILLDEGDIQAEIEKAEK